MEGLQSVLKQRDGEVQQLQWEIHRLQTERNFLSNEMSNLTAELEKVRRQSESRITSFIKIYFSGFRANESEPRNAESPSGDASSV